VITAADTVPDSHRIPYLPEFGYSNDVKTLINGEMRHFSIRNIGIFRCEKGKQITVYKCLHPFNC